jgi:hypothetical protein
MWRGGRDRECLPDSRGCLGTSWGVSDLDSDWEQEVSEKSSPRKLCLGILSLFSARDAVDEYFRLRRAFPLSELCEPNSFDSPQRSVLPSDLSLGLVCCDEAITEAPPVVALSESLYDASVCHEGSYDVSVRHEGLHGSKEIFLAELFETRCIAEWGCREDEGTADILANFASLQASMLEKAFPTDSANWRNINCNSLEKLTRREEDSPLEVCPNRIQCPVMRNNHNTDKSLKPWSTQWGLAFGSPMP